MGETRGRANAAPQYSDPGCQEGASTLHGPSLPLPLAAAAAAAQAELAVRAETSQQSTAQQARQHELLSAELGTSTALA